MYQLIMAGPMIGPGQRLLEQVHAPTSSLKMPG